MALNLERQLEFYGSYHHNPVNVAIHVTCVPIIFFTALLFAANTPAFPLPDALSIPNLPANLSTASAFLYAVLYILMEPIAGGLVLPIIVSGTALVNYLLQIYGATANYWAIGLHVASWIAQFVGHGKYEGRSPALLDNLVQALFLAPFFVWFEILFNFGYRTELKSRLDKAVEQNLAKFNEGKGKKAATNGAANGSAKDL
ncbi:DUF962 domain-containing protein [Lineolata rhizophorae]|uniref:DUF962 domain-containing protein n=1 Tax=Lineolata rhizophorae TaxID=578093 RepID=A0A6A6P7A9_9PEZI|nr:DUF962 domain-containing protein [Lineolata rhizophorae]